MASNIHDKTPFLHVHVFSPKSTICRCLAWAGPRRLLAAATSCDGEELLLEIDILTTLDASPVTAKLAGV